MKKLKRGYLLAILLVVLASISFIIFKAAEYDSSKPERYDLVDLESKVHELIQDYGKEDPSFSGELLSCHVFTQDNQVFAFFDYKPLTGDSMTPDEMPADVIERCLFFGYAKIEKRFNSYHIVDFQTRMHDTMSSFKISGGHLRRDDRIYCYGKILDDNIDKIEFYNSDVLIGTYYVGDKDYYFIVLDNNNIVGNIVGKVNHKFYDKENQLLGEL